MKWVKRGRIFHVDRLSDWAWSHTHKPTPFLVDDRTLRVYFGVRDRKNVTRTTFVDLDPADPSRVLRVHDRPVFDVGPIGAFDDSGANVSSVVRDGDRVLMYYIGWNPGVTVPTRNAIGLAVSDDGGTTFRRMFDGPVLDRTKDEPYYTGAVDVRRDGALWRVWYTSGTRWELVRGKPEICYHIRYGESDDGIDWRRENRSAIPPADEHEATARPCVIGGPGGWRMWYSRRSIVDFRTDARFGYRIGYAESADGIAWTRRDELAGLEPSAEGWDADVVAYPYVYEHRGRLVMLYNGRDFGRSGFGWAVPEDGV